jgi:hypothetical protein
VKSWQAEDLSLPAFLYPYRPDRRFSKIKFGESYFTAGTVNLV